MSSLLEDSPMPTRLRGWGYYLLPALVLLNVLLMLSLLGVLPPVFGDQPDPGRLSRQIDAERVRVVPGGAAAAEAASSAGSATAGQDADRQADGAPQEAASGNHQNASARSAAHDERQASSASASERNASDRPSASSRPGTADRQNVIPSGLSRNIAPGVSSARPRQDGNRRQEQQAGNRSN